jgi:TolA-binding protein
MTSTIDLALDQYDNERAYTVALKLLTDSEKGHLPSASYVSIGNALLKHNRCAEARDAYQKSLTMYPNDSGTAPLAQLGLGEAALGLDQIDEAEGIFHQAILRYPQSSVRDRAELGLAKVYLDRGHGGGPEGPDNAKAIGLLTSVMAGTTGKISGEAAYLLGNCYFSFGGDETENKKTALVYFLRASLLMSGPHGEEAAFRSGQCDKALGNPQIARRAFEAYLRRFPNGQFAADAKKELESLPAQPQQS